MSVAIVWGLVHALYPLHLQNLAYAVGFVILGGALFVPVSNVMRLARNPVRRAELRPRRLALVTAAVMAALVVLLAIPVNYRVSAPLVLMPENAARVYANAEGTLAGALPTGRIVHRGETIARLTNADTEIEIARLENEERSRKLRVEHLEKLRGIDREANDQLPTAVAALADSQRRLDERRSEAARLTLTAPSDGCIIAAPRTAPADETENRLPTWSGRLLDAKSDGAHVEPGTLVCLVGDPSRMTAVLLVNDTDVKRLAPGQPVRLRIEQLPGQIIKGQVVEIARHDVRDDAKAGSGVDNLDRLMAGMIPPGEEGAFYEARVAFELPRLSQSRGNSSAPIAPALIMGGRGEAKVLVERITLARRIYRFFAQTFRLPM
jgi:putative peptide zinc metalloprotease protein